MRNTLNREEKHILWKDILKQTSQSKSPNATSWLQTEPSAQFCLSPEDEATTSPGTTPWWETPRATQDFSSAFIGLNGCNTAAPQPGAETSQSHLPSQLHDVTEHPSSPLDVQKEKPPYARALNIWECKEIKTSSRHKVFLNSFITMHTLRKKM